MGLTCQYPGRGISRANKVCVSTTHSHDGRSLDDFWIDYNPEDSYALFLLQFALESSEGVKNFSVYDEKGERLPSPKAPTPDGMKLQFSKRQ